MTTAGSFILQARGLEVSGSEGNRIVQEATIGKSFNFASDADTDAVRLKAVSVPASSTTTLDLTAITDALGVSANIELVKSITVKNTGSVAVTLGGTGDFVPAITLPAGGVVAVCSETSGFVVDVSNKTLTLQNQHVSTAASVEIIIFGRLA